MELSQTDLITAVNKVLEDVGERRVLNLGSPVARKAVQALQTAVLDIANISDWEWLKDKIPAASWTLETADLGDTQRIHGVSVGSRETGYQPLAFIPVQEFDQMQIVPYSNNEKYVARYYTIDGYNKVRVNPYPINTDDKLALLFYVSRELVPPQYNEDKFPIPERLIPLIHFRACHYFCLSHLDDAAAAGQWANQFEAMVTRVRDRERMMPSKGTNLFKHRRPRNR